MAALNLREIYQKGITKFQLGEVATSLLNRVIAGDDKGMNFEEAIRGDRFFTQTVIKEAAQALRKGEVNSLAHACVLLGPENIRNFILGHAVQRTFDSKADSNFESISKTSAFVTRAIAAQEFAEKNGTESVGSAVAAGFVFDILEKGLRSTDEGEENWGVFCDTTWKHSVRTASLAWAFAAENPQIKLKKLVFTGGLLHDIGKLFLASIDPQGYHPLVGRFGESREINPDDDSIQNEFERERFGVGHTEMGSFLLHSTGFLRDFETIVDYHHDTPILKTRDPNLFFVSAAINIADRVSFLLETKNNPTLDELKKIIAPHKQSFTLSTEQVQSLAITLRSTGKMP